MRKNKFDRAFKLTIVLLPTFFYFNSFGQGDKYDVFVLEYAGNFKMPVSNIAVGATVNDSVTWSAMIWLLKGNNGRIVLVDAGFTDTAQYSFANNYVRPDATLQKINVNPGDITDLIVTHPHFDHIPAIVRAGFLLLRFCTYLQLQFFNWLAGCPKSQIQNNDLSSIYLMKTIGNIA